LVRDGEAREIVVSTRTLVRRLAERTRNQNRRVFMAKKDDGFSLPPRGFVFWPVGTGDSTTIVVDKETVIQVDLHHLDCSNDDGDPHTPIVDRLVAVLPKRNGKPYLAAFVLTHPDEDHCLGYADLQKRVTIGELWFSPRIFREYKCDLCDDACVFQKEAKRRVKKTIENAAVGAGDRVRIIGYDDLLKEDEYKGFPKERLTIPGSEIIEVDGVELAKKFRAFVHAPFKDDCDGERNDASLGLQMTLKEGTVAARALLLGDHCYPTVKRIFDRSKKDDLAWNVLLALHHCSKSVMYWKGEGDKEEVLKQDVLDAIEKAQQTPGHIVASSEPIPTSNKDGDNPPHAKAKQRYEEIAIDDFLCTQEHPSTTAPKPIVFEFDSAGLKLKAEATKTVVASALAGAVAAARGAAEPPRDRVGFGKRDD
jgi:beta-lactamase superfamily II metal-dependent hydrolase